VDVRIVAATNRDLAAGIASGTFRKDLFYRLNVLDLHTPPLRACRSDLPRLAARFLNEIAARQGQPVPDLEPAVAAALGAHDWPGNVRELIHALERAVALSRGGPIGLHHLPPEIAATSVAAAQSSGEASRDEPLPPLGKAVGQFERQYIQRALEQTGGHKGRAAALLGISRKSLWERLRDLRGPGDSQKG
jgi:DNA-binding NtrC family response regulator